MSFYRFQMFFVMLLVLLGLGACSSDDTTSNATYKPPVVLEDPENILSAAGIDDLQALQEHVEEVGPLAFSVSLQQKMPEADVEKTVVLLQRNNRNIEYRKLENLGVSETTLAKLKKLPLSPRELKSMLKMPDPTKVPMPYVTPEAWERLKQVKQDALNKKLALQGEEIVDASTFNLLQKGLEQVEFVDNYGNLNRSFQNVLARDQRVNATPSSARSAAFSTPDGYVMINSEIKGEVTLNLPPVPFERYNCALENLQLPLEISSQTNLVNTSLVHTQGDDILLQIPKVGVAVISATSATARDLLLKDADGNTLVLSALSDLPVRIYIPITAETLCKGFTFIGASQQMDIALVDFVEPERLSQKLLLSNAFYLSNEASSLYDTHGNFKPQSYSFSTIHSALSTLDLFFELDSDDEENAFFEYVLYAPSGTVYTQSIGGTTDLSREGLPREKGVWRLDLLPYNSVAFQDNKLDTLHVEVPTALDLAVALRINTDMELQTKEFVLGVMENVSFKTQGDDGLGNEGEIVINFNTSMAPKLSVPSYLQSLIDSADVGNEPVSAWLCWRKSEQSGLEFEEGGACYNYRATYLVDKIWYESLYDDAYHFTSLATSSESGEEEVIEIYAPYPFLDANTSVQVKTVMHLVSSLYEKEYQDIEYLNLLSNYYNLYDHWLQNTIISEDSVYPISGEPVKSYEHHPCYGEQECVLRVLHENPTRIPVIIETNRPIFGASVETMSLSTLPISFDYSGVDQDRLNTNAIALEYLRFAANQALNVYNGNLIGMICDSVSLVDNLHKIKEDAKDDPVGSARMTLNRYSVNDDFYGLNQHEAFSFMISGLAENNTQIDTFGQKLRYAQIACGVANIATAGLSFTQMSDIALGLDVETLASVDDIYAAMIGTSIASNSIEMLAEAQAIAALIEEGEIEEAKSEMQVSNNVSPLVVGTDLFDDFNALLNTDVTQGSAANGNNVVKSNAHYLLGTGKKSRAKINFSRVSTVPINTMKISLDRVKIISNQEADGAANYNGAEIKITPYVGVISDKERIGDDYRNGELLHRIFAQESMASNGALRNVTFYNGVDDGDIIIPTKPMLYEQESCGNVAALYIEVMISERDTGNNVEDNDMIGLFSQTIKLEDIFNKDTKFTWNYLGGSRYELKITEYPVYNSVNQHSLENPLDPNYLYQKEHNLNRRPSALLSFSINVEIGDIVQNDIGVDTNVEVGLLAEGHDTASMEMQVMNSLDMTGRIIDILDQRALVGSSKTLQLKATVIDFDTESMTMQEFFSYDKESFTGDLAPIREALFYENAPSIESRKGQYELSLHKLLADNRLLFVLSHESGARIMVVKYTNAGVMTLEHSIQIKDKSQTSVHQLLRSVLSNDRSRLAVPVIPNSYNDKHDAPHPELNLYSIEDGNVTFLSATSFGSTTSLHEVTFLDNRHLVVSTQDLIYDDRDTGYEYWNNLKDNCNLAQFECIYEEIREQLLSYNIDNTNHLMLVDTKESDDEVYRSNAQFNSMSGALSSYLYPRKEALKSVANSATKQLIRWNERLYNMQYNSVSDSFYFGASTPTSVPKSLRYNEVGAYYCSAGVNCSGYLSSVLHPSKHDTNLFQSSRENDTRIMQFEFADVERDILLARMRSGGENFIALVNLYNGAAYKGPQVEGEMFGEEISVSTSQELEYHFTITDRDTDVDTLDISIALVDIDVPLDYNATHISDVTCSYDANNTASCTFVVSFDHYSIDDLRQEIIVSVADPIFTTIREFTLTHTEKVLIPFYDATAKTELWQSDGTSSQTVMLDDPNLNGSSMPLLGPFNYTYPLSRYNNMIDRFEDAYYYFGMAADGNATLFKATLNGNVTSLQRVDSTDGHFIAYQNKIFYANSNHLAKIDKSTGVVTEVKTFNVGRYIKNMAILEDTLYFVVSYYDSDTSKHLNTLYKTQGDEVSTVVVKSLPSGYETLALTSFNDYLYFLTPSDVLHPTIRHVWRSNGTEEGTYVLDANIIANPLFTGREHDKHFVQAGGVLYFNGEDVAHGMELWRITNDFNGTTLVKDLRIGSGDSLIYATVVDEKLYISAGNSDDNTSYLWQSNGTTDGTVMLGELTFTKKPILSAIIHNVFVLNNTFYYVTDKYDSYELWAVKLTSPLTEIRIDQPSNGVTMGIYEGSTIGEDFLYWRQSDSLFELYKANVVDGKRLLVESSIQ